MRCTTNLKIKNLTREQLVISIDRLTRFKYTEQKYLRVFFDIILSNLIEPKFKKKDLEVMDYASIKYFAENIINSSLKEIFGHIENNLEINKKLKTYENNIFNLNENINILLDNAINYNAFINLISDNSVQNLKWLKTLSKCHEYEYKTKFPIREVVIVEGITEETLLPIFAKQCGFDFDEKGIQIVSAGGKNQVVKMFYLLSEQLKLPMFVLLDNDAQENYNQIKPKLRKIDKIHLINGGEFEDILPKELILRTLNDHFANLNSIEESEFEDESMVKNLEEIFKKKGFHEFKKAEFAQLIKNHVNSTADVSEEINSIMKELILRTSEPQSCL